MSSASIRIAVDCMGGDHGLSVTIPAVLRFSQQHPDTHFLLAGNADPIRKALAHEKVADHSWYEILPATEVVLMDDTVQVALRRNKDSSMRVAIQAIEGGRAAACVSAGNSGARMAVSRYVLKTLDGIERPGISTSSPSVEGGATTVLDLGASVDCS